MTKPIAAAQEASTGDGIRSAEFIHVSAWFFNQVKCKIAENRRL
jgi:hypothetical protein